MSDSTKKTTTWEYDIEQNSGYGWDIVDCQETKKLAQESVKVYRENMPHAQHRIRRVKAEN